MKILALSLLLLVSTSGFASHILGGYLYFNQSRADQLTLEITFVGFREGHSTTSFGSGILQFGDGESQDAFTVSSSVTDDGIVVDSFTVFHTYAAPGDYEILYNEPFRTDNQINFEIESQSMFSVKAQAILDPFLGANHSPQIRKTPKFFADADSLYVSDFDFLDPDGDSLLYEISFPLDETGQKISGYSSSSKKEYPEIF